MQSELRQILIDSAQTIKSKYSLLFERAKEDAGTSGDEGEKIWKKILEDWLPPTFRVINKARIVNSSNETSPQIDVVVIHPAYPEPLTKTSYILASAVVAAFECKNTLRSGHFEKFFKNGQILSEMMPAQKGLESELERPFIYGMLAHSHEWKCSQSAPLKNIENLLEKNLNSDVLKLSPREVPSIFCVADVATWEGKCWAFNILDWKTDQQIRFIPALRSVLTKLEWLDAEESDPEPLAMWLNVLYSQLGKRFPDIGKVLSELAKACRDGSENCSLVPKVTKSHALELLSEDALLEQVNRVKLISNHPGNLGKLMF